MLERHVLFIMDLQTIFFSVLCIVCIFLGVWPIYYKKNVISVQKIRLPIWASENLYVHARKPFFQKFTGRGKRANSLCLGIFTSETYILPEKVNREKAVKCMGYARFPL